MNYEATKKPVSLTLPANPFARTGYTLDSTNPWNSNSEGNGTAYKAKTAYSFTASATIYAKWNVNTYTVTIKSNNTAYGNVDKTSIANVPYNSTVTVSSNKITINETTVTATPATKTAQYTFTFTKWSVANGAKITGATTITATFSQTVNKYTVTFDANGGTTANPATITKDYNAEIGTLPTTTQANYVFNGWYTAKTGGTKISTTTKVTANVTYYAQWTSAQAKIGSTYFATLGDAVTYANNNSTSSHTIELLVNALTISSTLNINANITIKEVSGITNATIKRNVTTATFNMFNVSAGKSLTISGNSKTDLITLDGQGGAGIYSLIANNGTLSVNYVKFYNNNAVSTSNTAQPNVRGGAIHGLAGSTTSISNCTFNSNKANYGGALLFDETATISGISSSEFTSNTAYKYGGAVYLAGGKDIKFTSCKFTSNTLGGASGQMGDAFYIQLTNVTFDSCEFTSNTNKSHTIHVESTSIDKDNKYIVKFNNTTVTGSQLVYVSNNLSYKQDHVLTISGGSFANIQVATTAKTYTPVYISASATISKITFGQDGTLSSEASTKAIVFASSTLYNSMSSTLISGATVPSGYKLVGDGSTAINCCKVYTITINANGGTGGSASPSSYTIKTTAQTATLTQPTYSGYSFTGWTANKGTISGNTLTIPANTSGNITITANWAHNDVSLTHGSTVTYYTGGAKALTDALAKATSGDTVTLLTDISYSQELNIPASADGVTITSGSYTFTGVFVISALHVNFVNMNIDGSIDSTISGITDNHEILIDRCNINGNGYAVVPGYNSYYYIVDSTLTSDTYVFCVKGDNAHINFKAGSGKTVLMSSRYGIMYDGASNTEVVFDGSISIEASNLDYAFEFTDNNSNITIMETCSSINWNLTPVTAYTFVGCKTIDIKAPVNVGNILVGRSQTININADASFNITYSSLDIISSSKPLNINTTITKNHTITFNSNGVSSGTYYLYSSTSEATRNSMFDNVTLVDTYNLSKPNATQGKYTDGTNYYGMLYLGNVLNVTQQKAYTLFADAVSDATANDEIDIVGSHSVDAEVTVDKGLTIYSSTGATYTGKVTVTASPTYLGTNTYGANFAGYFYVRGATVYFVNGVIGQSSVQVRDSSTLYIQSSATIHTKGGGGILVNQSNIIMNGGIIYSGESKTSPKGRGVTLQGSASIILNGGEIYGTYGLVQIIIV